MEAVDIRLGEKIGSGGYRDCFEMLSHPGLCAKKLRNHRVERMQSSSRPFTNFIFFPTSWKVLERFGFRDLNKIEFDVHQNLPKVLEGFVVGGPRLVRLKNGESLFVSERVRNFDGSHAQTVQETGRIDNKSFWDDFDRLIEVIKKEDMPLFDMNPGNVLVKKIDEGHWQPIFIDIKTVGFQGGFLKQLVGAGWSRVERAQKIEERYAQLCKAHRSV